MLLGMPKHEQIVLAVLVLIACATPSSSLLIAVDARLPERLPSPPAGKHAPGFRETVRVNGRYVGLTADGLTVIEAPEPTIDEVRHILPGAHPYHLPAPEDRLNRFDEVVLLYEPGTSPPEIETLVLDHRVERRDPQLRFAVLEVRNPIGADTIKRLEGLPGVRFVEPNYRYGLAASPPPNDPDYLNNQLWSLERIGAFEAWKALHDSPARVAVIDTGIKYAHPDLAGNVWTNPGEVAGNGHDDDGNGCVDDVHGCNFVNGIDVMDTSGHGTWVSGIIGEVGNNGEGGTGVLWRVPLIAVRVFETDTSTADLIAKGVIYGTAVDARVMNASWSGAGAESVLLSDAITRADQHNALLVVSVGDSIGDIDLQTEYPASYGHENIIAVTTTDSDDNLIGASGPTSVDLGAPGAGIPTTSLKGYVKKLGNSFAVPHVTGPAALVWADPANGGKDAHAIKHVLLKHVTQLPSLAGKCVTGARLALGFLHPPQLPQSER
jgi:hypothetical protein